MHEDMKQTILVTGSSKGIGRCIALKLASDGFTVVVHYAHGEAQARETLDMILEAGGQGRMLGFDIAERAACRRVLEADMDAHGAYYGAVLNAGIIRDNAFPMMLDEEWDDVINTNLHGFYNVLRPIVMPMIAERKGGRIVAITSVSGLIGNRGQTNYSASKAGILAATKSLAIELAKRNITVNCVAPGIIETQMTEGIPQDLIKSIVPMRRAGKGEDVAATVSFLCSPGANYITRQVISVNGGMI